MAFPSFLESSDPAVYTLRTTALWAGPGSLPPHGGDAPDRLERPDVWPDPERGHGLEPEPAPRQANPLFLSTQGGIQASACTPVGSLGYHTGYWEVGLLVEAAARADLRCRGAFPW